MADPHFTVYRKMPCPYCDAAKKLLTQRDLAYKDIDLTGNDDAIVALKEKYGHATVPIILFDDKLIGGYEELATLDRSGELKQMTGAH